jgi:hypothetical protein
MENPLSHDRVPKQRIKNQYLSAASNSIFRDLIDLESDNTAPTKNKGYLMRIRLFEYLLP